jgi:hypothetical protein
LKLRSKTSFNEQITARPVSLVESEAKQGMSTLITDEHYVNFKKKNRWALWCSWLVAALHLSHGTHT